MVFDAYKTARARELGQPLPDPFGFESLWEGGRKAYSSSPVGSAVPVAGFAPGGATEPGETVVPPAGEAGEPCGARGTGAPIGAIVLIVLGGLFLLNSVANFPMWWFNR